MNKDFNKIHSQIKRDIKNIIDLEFPEKQIFKCREGFFELTFSPSEFVFCYFLYLEKIASNTEEIKKFLIARSRYKDISRIVKDKTALHYGDTNTDCHFSFSVLPDEVQRYGGNDEIGYFLVKVYFNFNNKELTDIILQRYYLENNKEVFV